MRDDLLDAQAAIDWAVAEIPRLQNTLLEWIRHSPCKLGEEPYSGPGAGKQVVAYFSPLPRIFNAWVGIICNSLRTSLDLLAAALATRNSVKPSENTHFPIFSSDQHMIDPLEGIEGKKWLSKGERAAIKALKPYQGGDHTIWPLHHLDIRRKHERLISASLDPSFRIEVAGYMISGRTALERFENKTVLAFLPGSILVPPESYTNISAQVTFNETKIGLAGHEVVTTLYRFAGRVAEIIKFFDT
jgi:hypothetical protein